MRLDHLLAVLGTLVLLGRTARAEEPVLADLSSNLRGLVVQFLPNPLYEDAKHWGGQKEVANGITWRGRGLRVHPEVQHKLKNHGKWWKVRVTAADHGESLVVQLRDRQQPEPGRMTFTAFISMKTDVDYERQTWDEGVRLYSGSVRARMRVMLTLNCEATSRLESRDKGLPDIVFRLRAVKSDFEVSDLVVEHVPGFGGDAAKLIGDAARSSVAFWRPDLERKLLDKANRAIVKGGDTKEIRVSLSKLLRQ
jgi:hypothetical protein